MRPIFEVEPIGPADGFEFKALERRELRFCTEFSGGTFY